MRARNQTICCPHTIEKRWLVKQNKGLVTGVILISCINHSTKHFRGVLNAGVGNPWICKYSLQGRCLVLAEVGNDNCFGSPESLFRFQFVLFSKLPRLLKLSTQLRIVVYSRGVFWYRVWKIPLTRVLNWVGMYLAPQRTYFSTFNEERSIICFLRIMNKMVYHFQNRTNLKYFTTRIYI